VREVMKSHLNYVVADTQKWEQQAAYILDTHETVEAFVKNAGLGFAIPYVHNGQPHDYIPDFIVRLQGGGHLVLETKGFDDLAEVKAAAAERWVAAVNADGQFGQWRYAMARKVHEVRQVLARPSH
jgi:type III restriction enzyme